MMGAVLSANTRYPVPPGEGSGRGLAYSGDLVDIENVLLKSKISEIRCQSYGVGKLTL